MNGHSLRAPQRSRDIKDRCHRGSFAHLTNTSPPKLSPSSLPPSRLKMSHKYWIPDPYLVQLITLRVQYEDLDGHLTDFDDIYKSGHHLTVPQDSLIRWIFQEVYDYGTTIPLSRNLSSS